MAINELCERFKWLVIKEAHKPFVYTHFGEDSENMIWEIFLEKLYEYDAHNCKSFPGWIKNKICYGILDKLRKESYYEECLSYDEIAYTITDNQDLYEKSEEQLAINQAINKLGSLQKEALLSYLAAGGKSVTDYCRSSSKQAAWSILKRAFKKLQAQLA